MINTVDFNTFKKEIDPFEFAESYADVLTNMAGLYADIAYLNPEPLVRNSKFSSTLFTSSGVQYMNRFIFKADEIRPHAFLISQPVVRMNYLPTVELGSYSSFINFGSMQMDVSYAEHERLTNDFQDVLTEAAPCGIELGDTTERTYLRDGLEYTTWQNNYSSVGLGVADSLFHKIRLENGDEITMSELGGGLERLLYNKSPMAMHETTGIQDVSDTSIVEIDAFRSSVLIAANNVVPANNNQGYQLRRLIKRLPISTDEQQPYFDSLKTDRSAYMFWKRLGGVVVSEEVTIATLRKELWRNTNLVALKAAGIMYKSKMDLGVEPDLFASKYRLV
jgi:hypothetical protein